MRKSKLSLYAPFIALALVQAGFVVFTPSEGESVDPLANLSVAAGAPLPGNSAAPLTPTPGGSAPAASQPGAAAPAASGSSFSSGSGVRTPSTSSSGSATPAAPQSGSAAAPAAAAGQPAGGAPAADGGAPAAGQPAEAAPQAAAGDTSHCTPGDPPRQTDLITTAPACKPKFTGDNGGATYQGVTGETIKLVRFQCQSNEQVDAILRTQGLAATDEETDEMIRAVADWIEATYETYGRTIEYKGVRGDCPSSPYDPAKSRQAAQEVLQKEAPFAVIYGDPAAQDVFANAGVISIAGPWQTNAFFEGRRPFRWDIFPSGTESAYWLGEYYCKKMAGGTATHAGQVIHPQIGTRSTPRKPGILTFDNGDGTTMPDAQLLQQLLQECTGGSVPLLTYESDIGRASEQTRATVAKLVDEKVTTLICMCDPVAPVFLTSGMTQNNYYPEHLLSGMYLTDYDILGRLYDSAQWAHAFGPSHIADQPEFSQSNASKIWRASGREGVPCAACNLITGYMTLFGAQIHYAGPNLNPLTVEKGLVTDEVKAGGWAATQNPYDYFIAFGPGDYNAISDYRQVYWSATARSEIDGRAGAYVSLDGGRRWVGGEADSAFDFPVPAQ